MLRRRKKPPDLVGKNGTRIFKKIEMKRIGRLHLHAAEATLVLLVAAPSASAEATPGALAKSASAVRLLSIPSAAASIQSTASPFHPQQHLAFPWPPGRQTVQADGLF